MTRTNRNSRRTTKAKSQNDYHVGVFQPDQFWGRNLRERFIPDFDLPFEERVERALRHIEATRFTEDEHEQLRGALVESIKGERKQEVSNDDNR